ncbi:MAG: DUF5916 domain-containing protein [Gemmatimonadales bacterium]
MFLFATFSNAAAAQQNTVRAAKPPPPTIAIAVRAKPTIPDIDGRLTDRAWEDAPILGGFTQRNPNEGEPGTEETEVRVVYSDAAIYVGIRAYDSHAESIAAHLTRRDDNSPSDWLGVAIDSYFDRRTGFLFMVNPAGVKRDIYLFDDNNQDASWDAVWDVATSRDDEGWTAEFRIPFSQIRFSTADKQKFGFNVYRTINRLNEEQQWKLQPKDQSGVVSQFGELVGIEGIKPPRRLEIMPYIVGRQEYEPSVAGDPFHTGQNRFAGMGADIKYGLTSNITLSATVNPDFGQVEADPAVVNLSAFETFFPEKRPFFNEGLDIFKFGIGLGDGDGSAESLFYTRRIGRAPQGSANRRSGYAEQIKQTTIYTAAKISGKTSDGWTLGITGAATAEEKASVIDSVGARFQDVVEPRSTYVVGRLAKDFRNGLTQVGLFTTAVNRSLPDNLQYLRSSAYTLGANMSHRFLDDNYSVSGWVVKSRVNGSEQAIELTQRSSTHYFQRPDNDHVTFDPTRTSLSGVAGQFSFNKRKGAWRYSGGFDTRSPGFEVNDLGFQRDADRTIQWTWINRRWLQPGKVFRRFNMNFNQWSVYNYGWDREGLGGNINMNFTLLNYWNGYFGVNREFSSLSSGRLRGGPAIIRPSQWNYWFGFSSDSRKTIRGGINVWRWTEDESGSWAYGIFQNLSLRPASNLDFTIAPGFNKQFNAWQYLTTASALNADQYVFGTLEQSTASMTFRGNMTFTPTLSLQVYAEPFISSGQYGAFRRVTDPRAKRFDDRLETFAPDQVSRDTLGAVSADLDRDGTGDISLGNPDFTFLSFRSNVVLRWEYVLGSTIFFVWQHGQTDFSNDGRFRLGSGIGDLFRAPGTDTFVIKLNYWLSP